jgi:hypothetical protein
MISLLTAARGGRRVGESRARAGFTPVQAGGGSAKRAGGCVQTSE